MKTSINRIRAFDEELTKYYAKHTKEMVDATKPGYAFNRILKQMGKITERFNGDLLEAQDIIRIKNCLTEPPDNPKGRILRNDKGGYEFSPEGELQAKKGLREVKDRMVDEENVEVTPYFIAAIPDDFSEDQIRAFTGFIISPEMAEAALRERELADDGIPVAPGNVPVTTGEIIAALDDMTDEERVGIINHYCAHCGSNDSGCDCYLAASVLEECSVPDKSTNGEAEEASV